MNLRVLKISLLAFFMLFSTLLLISCNKKNYAHEIERVLNICAENTKKINASSITVQEAAVYFASEMQKIDVRKCPEDFRVCFQRHIFAWLKFQVNDYSTHNEIQNTYEELTLIAAKYGARIPVSIVHPKK